MHYQWNYHGCFHCPQQVPFRHRTASGIFTHLALRFYSPIHRHHFFLLFLLFGRFLLSSLFPGRLPTRLFLCHHVRAVTIEYVLQSRNQAISVLGVHRHAARLVHDEVGRAPVSIEQRQAHLQRAPRVGTQLRERGGQGGLCGV